VELRGFEPLTSAEECPRAVVPTAEGRPKGGYDSTRFDTLVFDGAARYGARDSTSVVGEKGVACSLGPDLGHQAVELHTETGVARPWLTGSCFNDGFAGAMGELLCAIEDRREPLNSARGNLLSLKLCQATLRSVRTGAFVAV
jgi:predicted dehydrogenase